MKLFPRIVFVLACACLLTLPAMAQKVKISPKIGVNISGVDAELQDLTAESRVGWHTGLDLRVGDRVFYLNPGLHYYSNTARLIKDIGEDTPDNVQFEEETTIQTLRAPLNLGIRITGDNGLLGLRVKGGVTPAYVMSVNERPGFAFDKGDLNTFTLGANVGAGLDILIFTVDLNYEIGLNDYFADAEGRNNMLSLSVGLKF